MNSFLTIAETARLLGLHPQTVYRKIHRNEIPFVRFGRTIRIPTDQIENRSSTVEGGGTLPSFLSHLFWEYDLGKLKPSDPIVLERILELGDLPQWRWLQRQVQTHEIGQFLKTKGKRRLTPKSYRFWTTLFGENDENRRTTKDSTRSLGQTGWR